MAAIITDKVKNRLLKDLFQDFDSSATNYYIGIGRSQDWNATDTPPTPLNQTFDERDFRDNLQSVIAVADKSFVVPRNNWSSGTVYSAYSDYQVGYPTNPYYVVTDVNAVYVCIQQGRDLNGDAVGSTVQPTGVDQFNTLELDDGYIWKFLYTIGAAQANAFTTSAFIPVKFVDSASEGGGDLARDIEQFGVQNAALAGQVLGFRITNAGTGYTTTPSVTVYGNNTAGYRARAYGIIDSDTGTLVNVKFADSNDGVAVRPAFGRGYTYASAVVADPPSGTTAEVVPILGPVGGLGADPRNDLRSSAVMYNAKPTGRENGDFVVNNDYRQFGLLRNITLPESDGGASPLFTETTGRALRKLSVLKTAGTIIVDDSINGGTSGAKAFLDSNYNDSDLFYHQDYTTGFIPFEIGEVLSIGTGRANVLSDSDGEIDRYSGEVMFISNQEGIDRSELGTDDLKIVIQL